MVCQRSTKPPRGLATVNCGDDLSTLLQMQAWGVLSCWTTPERLTHGLHQLPGHSSQAPGCSAASSRLCDPRSSPCSFHTFLMVIPLLLRWCAYMLSFLATLSSAPSSMLNLKFLREGTRPTPTELSPSSLCSAPHTSFFCNCCGSPLIFIGMMMQLPWGQKMVSILLAMVPGHTAWQELLSV